MNRLAEKHKLATRWFHWINFPVLAVMIWSGLLIYWANDVYRVGFGRHTLFRFFPDPFYEKLNLSYRLAEGMAWHFTWMWFFVMNGVLYALFTAFSGEWKKLLPGRGALTDAIRVVLHDLRIIKVQPPQGKYNAAQRIAYTLVVFMGFGSLATGLAIYKPIQFGWLAALLGGYRVARFLHFWIMLGYVPFFAIHVGQVIRAGWNNFRGMVTGYEIIKETNRES